MLDRCLALLCALMAVTCTSIEPMDVPVDPPIDWSATYFEVMEHVGRSYQDRRQPLPAETPFDSNARDRAIYVDSFSRGYVTALFGSQLIACTRSFTHESHVRDAGWAAGQEAGLFVFLETHEQFVAKKQNASALLPADR